jgi:hypothetical protein
MDGSITVLGGTGFIGRHLAGLLVRSGERPFPSPQATDEEFKLRPSPTKRRNSSKPICLMTSLSPVQSRNWCGRQPRWHSYRGGHPDLSGHSRESARRVALAR